MMLCSARSGRQHSCLRSLDGHGPAKDSMMKCRCDLSQDTARLILAVQDTSALSCITGLLKMRDCPWVRWICLQDMPGIKAEKHLLQVTNLEALGTGNKRYKCRISDGSSSMEAVLGSEAAKLAAEGSLQEGGIFSAQDYVLNIINNVQKLFITCEPSASPVLPSGIASHYVAMEATVRQRQRAARQCPHTPSHSHCH